jgi:flagellar motor switch protein FliG
MIAMTGEEKAGLLLLSLDPEVAQTILAKLEPPARARLTTHMERLAASPQRDEFLAAVMQEAERLLEAPQLQLAAPREPAPPLPSPPAPRLAAFRPEPPAEEEPPQDEPDEGTEALNQLAPARLGLALDGESPRTIALVLNQLSVERAGTVYKQLPPDVRRDVAVQMGTSAVPAAAIVERTIQAVLAKARALPEAAAEATADARFKKMAELLRQLERPDRTEAIAALQERDPGVATQVLSLLYVFEDVLCLDGRSVQKVLGEIDSKTLATALSGATEDIKAKVIDNMSKRAREGLTEEMEFLGTVPRSQVQAAQQALVDVIQRLDQAGEIVMLR